MKRYAWNRWSLFSVASVLAAITPACSAVQKDESDESEEVSDLAQAIDGYALSNGPTASVAPGSEASVDFSAPAGHSALDWVGLHRVGAPFYEILAYQYVAADQGTLSLPLAQAVVGEAYEFEYFVDNSYDVAATSASFLVQYPPPVYALLDQPSVASPGSFAEVSWTAPNSHSTYDWVGLFVSGAADEDFLDFYYLDVAGSTSGVATIMIPADAVYGSNYEFRLYEDDFFDLAATAPPFSIGSALSVPSEPVVGGSELSTVWSAPASHADTDWIGVFQVDAPENLPLVWSYVGSPGDSTGSLSFVLPAAAPVGARCELRYFLNNSYEIDGQSSSFLIANGVSIGSEYVLPGANMNVSWTAPPSHAGNDWIGLYEVGAPSTDILAYEFVGAAGASSGSVQIQMSSSAVLGDSYELRYHLANTYELSGRSAPFIAGVVPYSVSEPSGSVNSGSTILTSWVAPAGHSATDWVALQLVGAAPQDIVSYVYVTDQSAGGSISIDVPAGTPAGSYELRYYTNNTYTVKAMSPPFAVN